MDANEIIYLGLLIVLGFIAWIGLEFYKHCRHFENINAERMRGLYEMSLEIEDWAYRAVQELQDLCDDAQAKTEEPEGETALPGTRALIAEFNEIGCSQ